VRGLLEYSFGADLARRSVGRVTSPPKPPVDPVRWQPPPVDPLPDLPSADLTVIPVPGNAPEDVVVDADGNIWTGVDDGRIVRISPAGEPTVVGETSGKPLGLAVARDGRLLVCTNPRGLLAMDTGSGKFEKLVEEVDGRPLQFCSNVTETSDGTIYFTESTSASPIRTSRERCWRPARVAACSVAIPTAPC
jgi:sugar lactone lactonase YvrE